MRTRVIRRIAVAIAVLLAGVPCAYGQVLYGAGPAPNSDPSIVQPSYLYRIDAATAQVTQIGPIGFPHVQSMDVDPRTGVLYATASRSTGGVNADIVLLTIDPATGHGTELMSWQVSNVGVITRLAVRRSDGAIFVGWGSQSFAHADPQDNSLNGVSGTPTFNTVAFDFSADDRLWGIHSEGNIFWRNLDNQTSGPPNDVFVQCCTQIDSLSFQPGTGTAFVVGAEPGELHEGLFALDVNTGALTPIGTFHPEGISVNYHLDIRALAWTEDPPADASLISWWRAENDATDSADGNDGELENGATFAPGHVGTAFSFDGVDDQVTVQDDPTLNVRAQATISAWINVSSPGHGRPIAQNRSSGNAGGYTFETTGSGYGPEMGLQWVVWINGSARILQTPANVLSLGTWQHVAATFDRATMRIFVDGVEKASMAAVGAIDLPPGGSPFVIGRNVVINSFAWHGYIDELQLYGRALNDTEIAALAGGATPPASTTVTVSATPSVVGGTTDLAAMVSPVGASGDVQFYVNHGAVPIAATYNPASGVASALGYVHGLPLRETPYDVQAVFTSASTGFASSETTAAVLVVGHASQTIEFGPLSDQFFGVPDLPLAATASSGLPVTFSIISGPATVTGTLLHLTGLGLVTVRATQPGNENYAAALPVERTFLVIAPVPVPLITCGDPLDGAIVTRAPGLLTFLGTVSTIGGVSAVTVNGTLVSVTAGGGFTAAINAAWGLNFVDVALTDGTGHVSQRTCTFLLAEMWAPDTETLTDTVSLRLAQGAVDDGSRAGAINSLNDILAKILTGPTAHDTLHAALLAANPLKPDSCDRSLGRVCLVRSEITYVGSQLPGPNTTSLALVAGGLASQTRFDNPQIRLSVVVQLAGRRFTVPATVTADFVQVAVTFDVATLQGRPRVFIRPNSVATSVGAITMAMTAPAPVDAALTALANGVIRDIMASTLRGVVTTQFTSILDGVISGLDVPSVPRTFEVLRLDGTALPVSFQTHLSSMSTSVVRVLLGLGTQVSAPAVHTRPTLGAPIPPGPRLLDPTITAPRTIGSGMHAGLLDQLLHAFWRGGYFDGTLTGGALPPGATVQLVTGLPPTADFRADGQLEIGLGQVQLHLDSPALLAQPLDGTVGLRIACMTRLDGDDLQIESCAPGPVHLTTLVPLDGATRASMHQLLAPVLASLATAATNAALPALPIPGFPIPAILTPLGLPDDGVLGLTNQSLGISGHHTTLRGTFGVR